jgi:hypothetical protein
MGEYDFPHTNTLPDLSALVLATPVLLVNFAWGSRGPSDLVLRRLIALFVSSTDLALKGFRSASSALDDVIRPSPDFRHLGIEVTENFEISLVFARRALAAFDRLRQLPSAPPIDRTARRLVDSLATDLVSLRDALVHMDERITDGRSPDGTPVLTMLSHDCCFLGAGAMRIATKDLAGLLRHLNTLAHYLARTEPLQS